MMSTLAAIAVFIIGLRACWWLVGVVFRRRVCAVCERPVKRWSHRAVRLPGGRGHWACVHPSDERIRRMVERAR
jgi:hypothetical protein